MLPPIELQLLGRFVLKIGGTSIRLSLPAQQLIALLGLNEGQPVPREVLAAKIWPDASMDRSRFYLRRLLLEVKDVLPADCLLIEGEHLSLGEPMRDGDLPSLLRKLGRFREPLSLSASERERIARPLLQGVNAVWLSEAREVLSSKLVHGLLTGSHQRLADQFPEEAIEFLQLALTIDPLHEQVWRALFRALASSGNLAQVTVRYREMCARFQRELELPPSLETHDLVQSLLRVPPPVSFGQSGRRFPLSGEPFVGREESVSAIESRLADALMTVIGVGGMGKTRIASFVAERHSGRVFWFSMGYGSPNTLASRIAKVFQTSDPESALFQRLSHVSALFVIDNAESASALDRKFIESLRISCPGIRVLATSREPLGVAHEQLYLLNPVTLPISDTSTRSAAFELFSAYLPKQGKDLTRDQIRESAEICELLGGVPLALKLAALRAHRLSISTVLEGLKQDVQLVDHPVVDPSQSIRAAFDWSFSRLSPQAKQMYISLSPIEGAWSTDLAFAVGMNTVGLDELMLSGLVIKTADQRYRSVNPLRQFALIQLAEDHLLERRVSDQLVAYFEGIASRLSSGELQADQVHEPGLRFATQEMLKRAIPIDSLRAIDLANALGLIWLSTGNYAVGASWFDEFIRAQPAENEVALASIYLKRANCAAELYDLSGAVEWCRRGIDAAGNEESLRELAFELRLELAHNIANQGALGSAQAELDLAMQLARELGNEVFAARVMQRQAFIAGELRQYDLAHDLLGRCLDAFLSANEVEHFLSARETLGVTLLNEDRRDEADIVLKDCDAHRLRAGQEQSRHLLLNCLAEIANRRLDFESAIDYTNEALSILSAYGLGDKRVYALQLQARAYAQMGDFRRAIDILEEVLSVTASAGMDMSRSFNLSRLAEIYERRGDHATARAYHSQAEAIKKGAQLEGEIQRCNELDRNTLIV